METARPCRWMLGLVDTTLRAGQEMQPPTKPSSLVRDGIGGTVRIFDARRKVGCIWRHNMPRRRRSAVLLDPDGYNGSHGAPSYADDCLTTSSRSSEHCNNLRAASAQGNIGSDMAILPLLRGHRLMATTSLLSFGSKQMSLARKSAQTSTLSHRCTRRQSSPLNSSRKVS